MILDEAEQDQVERALRRLRPKHAPDATVIVVLTPTARAIYQAGRLHDDHDRAPDELSIFEIGSVTKVFTSLALAASVVDGEVALDEPITAMLPRASLPPDSPAAGMTPRSLATHTSGLPQFPGRYGRRVLASALLGGIGNPLAGVSRTLLYDALAMARPSHARRPRYSSFGYAVLGEALAHRAGTDFAALLRERVTAPLGLHDTVVTVPERWQGRAAHGHTARGLYAHPWDLQALAPAGGLHSTADDLLKLVAHCLGYGELPDITRAALDLSWERHAAVGARMGFGLGWAVLRRPGAPDEIVLHDGLTGGHYASVSFAPQAGTGLVVLCARAKARQAVTLRLATWLARHNAAMDRVGGQ